MPEQADVHISNHGSVWLFTPMTKQGRDWVDSNVELESWQWLGGSFSVDHRYVEHLGGGMMSDGLLVEEV